MAHWEWKKLSRRYRSTNTGECLAFGSAHDSAIWLQRLWFELTGESLPLELITDCGDTGVNLATKKLTVERRNRMDMAILRQDLRRGKFATTWVPSRANLSNVLTKEDENKRS